MNYTKTKINSASIPLEEPPNGFSYDKARGFQKESIQWYNSDNTEPILVLQSPTGSGKTAAFTHMAKNANKSLFIYPTNSLIKQQKEILENKEGINPKIINSSTIDGSAHERTKSLRKIIQRPANDVFLTNPDILEAIIQGQYIDPSDSLIREVFEYMNLVVYDEFHYYDEFESSGLLLQTKILSERMDRKDTNPNIVFSSATPNQDYLRFTEDLGLAVRRLRTDVKDGGEDRFRQETTMKTVPEDISKNHREILDELRHKIGTAEDLENPSVAVIFNSAKESNRFNRIAQEEYENVYENIKIDNGYNTYDKSDEKDDYYILNTTSKGEVGLDFDIKYLYMQIPFTAPSFIQRFGRAGRHSKAEVQVYGFESKDYDDNIEYKDFISSIYDKLPTPQMNGNRIQNLIGMRSAVAIQNRENEQNRYNNTEVYNDLVTVRYYDRWKKFFNSAKPVDDLWKNPDSTSKKTLQHIQDCSNYVLSSLRGSSNSVSIEFSIGDEIRATKYSAITALSHYCVKDVEYDENKIVLGKERQDENIQIQYKNYTNIKEEFYDFRWSNFPIDDIKSDVYKSNFCETVNIRIEELLEFYNHLNKRAKIANRVYVPELEDYIDLNRLK